MSSPVIEDFQLTYERMLKQFVDDGKMVEISRRLQTLETDRDRMEYMMGLPEVQNIPFTLKTFTKSGEKSEEFRKKGNILFRGRKFHEALVEYNRSLVYAPYLFDKVKLSLAYANRSAVFFEMGLYEESRKDASNAMLFEYPLSLMYKLYERYGKCFMKEQEFMKAVSNYEDAIGFIDNADIAPNKKTIKLSNYEDSIRECKKLMKKNLQEYIPARLCPEVVIPELTSGENRDLPNASDAICMAMNDVMGRNVIAKKDIKPGDVLIVERPYCSVLDSEYRFTHCHHCLRRSPNLIPCPLCIQVMYCSETCRDASRETYHPMECEVLPSVASADMRPAFFVTLRMLTTHKAKSILQKMQKTEGPAHEYHVFSPRVVENKGRVDISRVFKRALKAVILMKCLKPTSFFQNLDDEEDKNKESFYNKKERAQKDIAGLILTHLSTLPLLLNSVSELIIPLSPLSLDRTETVGCALYTTCSLINHSCDPNVRAANLGDTTVVRAVRHIAAGESVLASYGCVYYQTPLIIRQAKLLEDYNFSCMCEACFHQYPVMQSSSSNHVFCAKCCTKARAASRSEIYAVGSLPKCKDCHHVSQRIIPKVVQELQMSAFCLVNRKYPCEVDGAILTLTSCMEKLHQHVVPPWQMFAACQEYLAECFLRKGNLYCPEV